MTSTKYPDQRYLSLGAQAAARWFQQLARGLRVCRLYPVDNPTVVQIRKQLLEQLNESLREHGVWRLRVTPLEIWLVDEPIVHPSPNADSDVLTAKAERLPPIFYRDGLRGLTFMTDIPASDFDSLFDAMVAADRGPTVHDDLVTLLWQAHPVRIKVDAVPLTQTIYLSTRKLSPAAAKRRQGLAFLWSPTGDEIRSDIGQAEGVAQGLHLDTFDDWPLPKTYADVPTAYAALTKGIQFVRSVLMAEWSAERGVEWTTEVPSFFRRVLEMDPSVDTRLALAHSVLTWLLGAVQRFAWSEAQDAFRLLREFDPDGSLTAEAMVSGMAGVEAVAVCEHLDESTPEDLSLFLALAVALGKPAIDLACTVMANATRARTRAAACTMLCYLCGDEPELLAPYLGDERWYVVRNTVFVLGQIGGPAVVEMLRFAAAHNDPRVRRQVALALGNVPREERFPLLAPQLATHDSRLLATVLGVLGRDRGPEIQRAILRQLQAPSFDARSDDIQRQLFHALADVGDDAAVPVLGSLLQKGGWFARSTPQRIAVAQTLARIGTEQAVAVLEAGLRSGGEAVRLACLQALSGKAAA